MYQKQPTLHSQSQAYSGTETQTTTGPAAVSDPYREQKIMTASPEELIKYLYDAGVVACKRQQKDKALQVVQELINSLRYDHKEVAMNFYRTYRAIMELISHDKYDRAATLLSEIRDTWVTAMKLK